MKYRIEFQYASDTDSRPADEAYLIVEGDNLRDAVIPNVGDYVLIEHSDYMSEGDSVVGKVRSRFFSYAKLSETSREWCNISIVVEATDDDLGMILKQ